MNTRVPSIHLLKHQHFCNALIIPNKSKISVIGITFYYMNWNDFSK